MKVTGWTFFDNENYIDIAGEATKLRINATKDIPKLPNREEISRMSKETLETLLTKRKEQFEIALDSEEIHAAERLVFEAMNTVVEDVKEHGYRFTGNDHQNAPWGTPVIDDKYILCLSQRGWGAIIAEAFPEEIDDSNGLGYIKWAWYNEDTIKIPNEEIWIVEKEKVDN